MQKGVSLTIIEYVQIAGDIVIVVGSVEVIMLDGSSAERCAELFRQPRKVCR